MRNQIRCDRLRCEMLCQSFPNSAGVNCCITLAPCFNQSAYTERRKGRRWKAGLSSECNYNLFQFRQVMTLQGVFTFVDQYLISWIILRETKEGGTMLTGPLVMVLEANSIWLIDYQLLAHQNREIVCYTQIHCSLWNVQWLPKAAHILYRAYRTKHQSDNACCEWTIQLYHNTKSRQSK